MNHHAIGYVVLVCSSLLRSSEEVYVGETLIHINSCVNLKWHNKCSLHVVTDQSK